MKRVTDSQHGKSAGPERSVRYAVFELPILGGACLCRYTIDCDTERLHCTPMSHLNIFILKGLVVIYHSFYIYFLSYNTLQNKVDHITHNLLLDEAWACGRYELNQWLSRDYITKLCAGWCF